MPLNDIAAVLGEIGAWGVNLHDNDLVPASPPERKTGPSRTVAVWFLVVIWGVWPFIGRSREREQQ